MKKVLARWVAATTVVAVLMLLAGGCTPATAPASTTDSPSALPAVPAARAPAPDITSARASRYLAATATIDGETVLDEATSDSGVWVLDDDRFVIMLSLSPDTIAQISRSEWEAYTDDWGRDQANGWLLQVMDSLWPKQLNVTIENRTSRPLAVVWEESALLRADGGYSRVIKSGVRFSEMDDPVPPTSIPPGARIDDIIAPVDRINYSQALRKWQQAPILYAADIGRAFSLFLALEVDGEASYISIDLDITQRIQAVVD